MSKIKELLDLRATWATIGLIAGSLFGEQGAAVANALGLAVMAVL
jgi:hypothetical protein